MTPPSLQRRGPRRAGCAGMTLWEVILAILIVAITVPASLSFMASVAEKSARTQLITRAAFLGHALMEEILSKRFDEMLEKSGGSWSFSLGQDAQDNGTFPSALFDDVDDYDGFSETLSTAYGSFTRTVLVEYVKFPEGLELITLEVVMATPGDDAPGAAYEPGLAFAAVAPFTTDYKRITVTVSEPTGVSIQLIGVATTANSQGVQQQS